MECAAVAPWLKWAVKEARGHNVIAFPAARLFETKPRAGSSSWEQSPFIRRAVKRARAVRKRLTHVTEAAAAFSMEAPADNLSIENEVRGEAEEPGGAEKDAAQSKASEEPAPNRAGGLEAGTIEEAAASCCPIATERPAVAASQPPGMERSTYLEPQTLVTVGTPQSSQSPAPELHSQRTPKASIAEMDCLICFNRYSASRLPKLLACHHAFCAVCLKLILKNEDHTWIIACPLCRKSTVVFGGLICSLRDKEDILGRLESPDPEAEVPCPPHPPGMMQANRRSSSENREPQRNQAASKRLMLLLLLVTLLLLLILPFMYTGMLQWALCGVVALGLIVSGVLCCNPRWNCSDCSLPPWRKKERHVASVA
ncbi:E3 ubiquitin-protein ligase RNF186 [Sphaerodactylus townsendi]|uniref:E3 ubiquitin-protein ligase RNF186 n=1 Tax=Sphaerodactylus townsendi TaxID=933632 RepID=UPI002026E243|nr:E3 ubiquitin-protein ligase RNF186 [Sphaerodactylus townsendi]